MDFLDKLTFLMCLWAVFLLMAAIISGADYSPNTPRLFVASGVCAFVASLAYLFG
ncbi:MAG: hypothetical protein M0R03_10215 [Novosphingobium sp.]|nr:hypothetical protein [Novosphingobium sp.]